MKWTAVAAEDLAREVMPPLGVRWSHVRGVAARAQVLTGDESVIMAAWLHDVGYVDALHRTGMHAVDGAMYLDMLGAPQPVVSLVAFHTGAVFEAKERGLLDELLLFGFPDEHALDVLTLADLTTSPTGELVSVEERVTEILSRYETQHPVHRGVVAARAELVQRARRALLPV